MYEPVDRQFFEKPVLELAKELIGHLIVHELPTGPVIVRIVETEAYHGAEDRAAHSFGNRRTKRTEVMFGEPGSIYTYQMHTHTLMNVVCGPPGTPHAILLRAGEPVDGLEYMRERRGEKLAMKDWTSGPGKLSKALGVTMDYYGRRWFERPLFIARTATAGEIESGPRVGIANSGEAVHYPYRFFEKDNAFVSKYRP
ncbi:putative 3-methyladenine DNA glycosylase [Sporosarcina sp. NCCP-2716]|uniref:DNA-3-methyladenine glycosylase n=1 Tax=Sporosarcina sp. NCCP-2716 TaxID=2943679 RepID=UPI00203A820D|nr:DNA-3-methyladenine glycosylase [Sporosarcina sp. NCCP-2716]GKV68307.1 putative 3-methyladenine DNA glycosylase [Sporosarcina sp. NCCP-2716]